MKPFLYILFHFTSVISFGQISGRDIVIADLLVDDFQNHIDSINQLTSGAEILFFSDSLFKGMILTLGNGKEIELDLRYKENFRGYTELGVDFENHVLIKHRGDGSGNPAQLRVINKMTGEDNWLGNYPFYLDKVNEIAVYKTYTDSSSTIVVHDFSLGKIETYSTPDTKCLCCGCFEIVQFDNKSFTIKFVDSHDNMIEKKMKRKNNMR